MIGYTLPPQDMMLVYWSASPFAKTDRQWGVFVAVGM